MSSASACRRLVLRALAAAPLILASRGTLAQPRQKPVVIGWLGMGSRTSGMTSLEAFKEALAGYGWKEGAVNIEARWADGNADRLKAQAGELAARKPALIVGAPPGSRAVIAAVTAAPDVPVVQASGGDLVEAGLAKNYARPGGMVTGITIVPVQASEKFIELLLLAAPQIKRLGFLMDPNVLSPAQQKKIAQQAAQRHMVEPHFASAAAADDIDRALVSLLQQGVQGLVPMPSPLFGLEQQRIMAFAQKHRLPVVGGSPSWVRAGALLSYGYDTTENVRRAAYFVDRILRGSRPGDLPIEQPLTFQLIVNAKTAKALGLSLPRELLLRADKVLE